MYYKIDQLKNILASHKNCVFSLDKLCESALEYIEHLETDVNRCYELAKECYELAKEVEAKREAAQPKWISVEEPPKHTCDYLVYVWVAYPDGIAHMQMRTGVYNIVRKEWTIPHDQSEVVGEPEYWMPLPSMEGIE